MHRAFHKQTSNDSDKYGGKLVEDLFSRRNRIAHQNDRDHVNAAQTDITKEYVEWYISCIEAIVNAIHDIAKEKDAAIVSE